MGHSVGHGDRSWGSSGFEQELKPPVACEQKRLRHASLCVSACASMLAGRSAGMCCAKLERPEFLFIKY